MRFYKDKKSHFTKVSSPQGIKLEREKIKEFYCKKSLQHSYFANKQLERITKSKQRKQL